MKKKKIAILGSTGSIGTQALDVIRHNRDKYEVAALSCGTQVDLLREQIEEFRPQAFSIGGNGERLNEIATMPDADIVLNSLMGMKGLEPTLAAIEAGKDIAFANKETLVAGGELVMEAVRRKGVRLLPVDSEHSAIFQALQGNEGNPVKRIILTASGGPFRGYSREQLERVTLAQALKHPNWSMGSKITIDSASMMNKGLEIIEAKWLFDVPLHKIQVVVHPQSVLHSAVEYEDGSVIGQMGNPDMRVPIAYAFSYPDRLKLTGDTGVESLDLFSMEGGLSFYPADDKVFKTIALARQASEMGGSYPVVLNGANEELVDLFLHEKIRFIDIQDTLERIMHEHRPVYDLTLEGVLEEDRKIRDYVRKLVEG
ncbi:MAG: 1-deoxy-D-xylulose-5-phosphate reductoisomerase [Bacillota bacterium]|nr:1-deoxy-D-xylulose-5-phosphate reductoisomerase [Bacillota bacterium]